nr:DUF1194 domain-containing protein [Wenxinia marina]
MRALAFASGMVAADPAAACRLALALALDVSSSVDAEEDGLQRRGLASALLAPEIEAAFFASADPVALYVFEWSGRWDQVPLTDGWQLIETREDLLAVAEIIAASPRSRSDMPTALGAALGHAAVMLDQAPGCLFRTLDVAGDGINNEGFGPLDAYNAFDFEGVTVNGLVVIGAEFGAEAAVAPYFQREVIRGPGAFIQVARGYGDYERAMRRKLERELAAIAIGDAGPAAGRGGGPG